MTDAPARGVAFFGGPWTGAGEIRDRLGRSLQRVDMVFSGKGLGPDGALLMEEVTAHKDGTLALRRAWRIRADCEGACVGVGASQGGRLLAEDRGWGFTPKFDRPTVVRARNVTNLGLRFRRNGVGLEGRGWSRILGAPLFRTETHLSSTRSESARNAG